MADTLFVGIVDPPDEMRAEIGYRCGHGCVRCGVTVHVFAGISDGETDVDMASVALLCPSCFGLLSQRPITREQFAVLVARPVARDLRFDRSRLPYFRGLPDIVAGGMAPVHGTSIPILVDGHPPLAIIPPMSGAGAMRIDLRLADAQGEQCHIVRSNAWYGMEGGWRFSYRSGSYEITSPTCDSRLVIQFSAPDTLTIVHLLTMIEGKRVEMTPRWLDIDGARITGAIASNRVIGFEI
ncbi:MAG: hypothetical protein AB7U35_00650 [Sphingobium sp.]